MIFAGPLRHGSDVGGVVVLFEDLINSISPDAGVFDTNAKNYTSSLSMIMCFTWCCVRAAFKGDEVALHGTARDYKYLGFIVLICHYLLGLNYHTRKFAGNFDEVYVGFSTFWRWSTRQFLFHSHSNFFETKSLVEYFSTFNSETFWFPNYRPETKYQNLEEFQGRFVFVGHVKREKGLDEIIALGTLLPDEWLVDVYGPLSGYSADDFRSPNVRYQGVLPPEDVASMIAKYNALLLPTFHEGEGYPGVILEAYSVSAPVVATIWRALPEIVDDNCGVLVEPGDALDLLRGMKNISVDYQRKRIGASQMFDDFSREVVLDKYFSSIRSRAT
ncbi:hypothetical protein A9Q89_04755 [Gammaproteobacteria bacterium 53_120_T64]|nr:hypothetical protein A9Q89_04755 [Gammaproteobacteria bacterium 53_120_T64]